MTVLWEVEWAHFARVCRSHRMWYAAQQQAIAACKQAANAYALQLHKLYIAYPASLCSLKWYGQTCILFGAVTSVAWSVHVAI